MVSERIFEAVIFVVCPASIDVQSLANLDEVKDHWDHNLVILKVRIHVSRHEQVEEQSRS